MKKIGLLTTLLIGSLLLTGCNKTVENPEINIDEAQTNSFGIFHNIEEGTITLDNGEESITIMDRNLGAEIAGTGEESYGYYFQWGNNHGFSLNSEIKTGKDLVTRDVALQYGPNNWYDSDVQFVVMDNYEEVNSNINKGNYFLAAVNDNLWGGSGDNERIGISGVYSLNEFRLDTRNPRVERQGPCPEGFHVPSRGDVYKLVKIRASIEFPGDDDVQKHIKMGSIGKRGIGNLFRDDLLWPMAGGIRFDGNATPHEQNFIGYYRMSSPGRFLNFRNDAIIESPESYRAATFPVRCFKD